MLHDDVRNFLNFHGIRLQADLGQHFLIDEKILSTILQSANVKDNDQILEIGPGIGILTQRLLAKNAVVTAIEIDPRMIPLLKIYVTKNGTKGLNRLTVIQGNALHTDISIKSPFKVVANIPYHITSPLLTHLLLEAAVRPTTLTLLIQREVAENICSETTESLLTALVHFFGKAHLVRMVKKEAFLPPPKVESAVLHIDCYESPLVPKETIPGVLKLVKHAMSQRRKMLSNTIGSLAGGMEALQKINIEPTRRPQTLTITEWIALEETLRRA